MSKAIRFPESAIADGRVGTARIREEIAGAAAHMKSLVPAQLEKPIERMLRLYDSTEQQSASIHAAVAALGLALPAEQVLADWQQAPNLSPVQRMQKLGRLGTGVMNKTESAYEQVLAARRHVGEILWYRFEGHKLRLADNTFYTPDFAVIVASGALEFHEVKGRWTDKGRAKTKVAAAQYPHRFIAVKRAGRHGWQFEDMTSKSW